MAIYYDDNIFFASPAIFDGSFTCYIHNTLSEKHYD